MTLRNWNEVDECKTAARAQLESAARRLREPGAGIEAIMESLAEVTSAKLSLVGLANGVEVLLKQAVNMPDGVALRAGMTNDGRGVGA